MAEINVDDIDLIGCWPVNTVGASVPAEKVLQTGAGKLLDFCRQRKVQEIIVAVDERRRSDSNNFPLDQLLDCKLDGIDIVDDLTFLERESGQLDIRSISAGWLVFSDGFSFSPLRDVLERGFDVIASVALLLVTWPFMLFTLVAIKLEDGLRAPLI